MIVTVSIPDDPDFRRMVASWLAQRDDLDDSLAPASFAQLREWAEEQISNGADNLHDLYGA